MRASPILSSVEKWNIKLFARYKNAEVKAANISKSPFKVTQSSPDIPFPSQVIVLKKSHNRLNFGQSFLTKMQLSDKALL